MGADGGYLPVRCDLMKLKPKEKKIDNIPRIKTRSLLLEVSFLSKLLIIILIEIYIIIIIRKNE